MSTASEASDLVGTRVGLRAVTQQDYPFLFALDTDPATSWMWRYRGATPPPEEWVRRLWDRVATQYLVLDRPGTERLGIVVCHELDLRSSHAQVSAAFRADLHGHGWPLEGLELFVDYLFTIYPLRRIYFDVREPNLRMFASGVGGLVTQHARIPEHELMRGRYVDRFILTIERAAWEARRENLLRVSLSLGPGKLLSLDRFCNEVAELIGTDPEWLDPDADLIADLELDSFALVTIFAFLDELGAPVKPPDGSAITLGALHTQYAAMVAVSSTRGDARA